MKFKDIKTVDNEIKNMVDDPYFMNGQVCFSLNARFGYFLEHQIWTICSFSINLLELLINRIKINIIRKVLNERGITKVEFEFQH